MATFPFLTLPDEMQIRILEECDIETLYRLCRTNRELLEKAHPILWTNIDFVALHDHYHSAREQMTQFFATCDTLFSDPDSSQRWEELAALPRILRLTCLPGPKIVYPDETEDDNEYPYFEGGRSPNLIYNIIACFHNLHTLTVYIKDDWDSPGCRNSAKWKNLRQGLTHLKTLKIGGQTTYGLLEALLSRPENMENLSLVNITRQPGQGDGPDALVFLDPIKDRFTALRRLHLSKLAELHEDHSAVAGLRWGFDGGQELAVLRDWAQLLARLGPTLESLTLENCYHNDKPLTIDDQNFLAIAGQKLLPYSGDEGDDVPTYGQRSSNRCRDVLGPILEQQDWPRLRKVRVKGMYSMKLPNLTAAGVQVEYLPGSFADVEDVVTPLRISPPGELMKILRDGA